MKREDLYARSAPDIYGFEEFIEKLGGNLTVYAHKAGFTAELSKSEIHFVSWAAMVRCFEIAAKELNEPYFGLKWAFAQPKDYRNSGPTLFMGSIANDLKHLLDMAIDYQKIHTNGVSFSYKEDVAAGELIGYVDIHPLSPPCRQFCEHILAGIAIMQRRYLPDISLLRASFQYEQPEDMEWYEKAFECPVLFNAPRNAIVTNLSVLEMKKTPILTRFITPFMKAYLKRALDRNPLAKQSIKTTVIDVLPSLLGVQSTDIETVANALNVHPKKLQRLLKDEDTTYKELLDDVRKSLAERLLIETDISITRMAKMLDYSSDRPFTVAFKRWFGVTPSKYRQEQRAN